MLIKAMRAFYTAVGGFALAALISLLGAVFTPLVTLWAAKAIEILAVGIGSIAVGALVKGSLLLVKETRVAVMVMEERAAQAQTQFAKLEADTVKLHSADARLNNSARGD